MAKNRENTFSDLRRDVLNNIDPESKLATQLNDPSLLSGNNIPQKIFDPSSDQIGQQVGSISQNDVSQLIQPQVPLDTGITPQSADQQIVNQTLSGINREGAQTPVDEAINRSIFGAANQAGVPIEQQDPLIQQGSELFRGLNDPILKGNVSGQVIGNQPIFVGGGNVLAMDVLNNRRKAIQDAAIKKQEDLQKLLSIAPPIVKDQRFQKNLNQQFNNTKNRYIALAQEQFGDKWGDALKDQSNPLGRGFIQDLSNYNFIAGQADQVTDLMADIDKNLETGDTVFSDETLDLRDQYNQLQGAFLDGRVTGSVDLAEQFDKLKGFANLDKVINDQGIDIEGTVTGYASVVENDNNFVTTTQKKKAYEDQVRIIAAGLAKSQMRDAVRKGLITEDEIFDRINARYGYENVITKNVTTKPTGGATKFNINLGQEFGEEKVEKIGGADYTVFDAIEVPTGIKPLSASGLITVNPDGTTSRVDGVRDVDLNSFQIVEVPDPNNPNQFIKKKVIVGTHEERERPKDPKSKMIEKTVLYDMDQIGSRIKTDLLQEPDQWEEMNRRFDSQLQQENQLDDISGFQAR